MTCTSKLHTRGPQPDDETEVLDECGHVVVRAFAEAVRLQLMLKDPATTDALWETARMRIPALPLRWGDLVITREMYDNIPPEVRLALREVALAVLIHAGYGDLDDPLQPVRARNAHDRSAEARDCRSGGVHRRPRQRRRSVG